MKVENCYGNCGKISILPHISTSVTANSMKMHVCIPYGEWHLNIGLLWSLFSIQFSLPQPSLLHLAGSETQTEQQACCQPLTQPFWGATKAWEEVLCSRPPGASLHFISAQRAGVNQSVFYCQVVICEQSGWLSSACHLSPRPAAGLYATNWLTCSHSLHINMAAFNKWEVKKGEKGKHRGWNLFQH